MNKADFILIGKIAARANNDLIVPVSHMTLVMDLENVHTNSPLRLTDLLEAPHGDFAHDIFGIVGNMDRSTGKLANFFEPRYTDYSKDKRQ